MSADYLLRRGRNLAPRELDPVMRPESLDLPPQVAREQIIRPDAQDSGEDEKLQIRNAPILRFQTGYRLPTRIPSCQLKFCREFALRPPLFLAEFTHLWSNDV